MGLRPRPPSGFAPSGAGSVQAEHHQPLLLGARAGRRSWSRGSRPSWRSTAASSGGPGYTIGVVGQRGQPLQAVVHRRRGRCRAGRCGRSRRGTACRRDTSRPSTRKHWLPGVWPGVWTSVIVDVADLHDVAGVVGDEVVVGDARSCVAPTAPRRAARGSGSRRARAASAMPSIGSPSSSRRRGRRGSGWRARR